MKIAIMLGALATAVAATSLTMPVAALAQQDCGMWCGSCGEEMKEGWGEKGDELVMSCFHEVCKLCDSRIAAGGGVLGAGELAEAISDGGVAELKQLLPRYKARFYLDDERDLLAITGLECSQDQVVAVVFLTKSQMSGMAAMRIPRLRIFLAMSGKKRLATS